MVALRWNLPIHEVEQWQYQEVLRHFKIYKYEIEKHKEACEEENA